MMNSGRKSSGNALVSTMHNYPTDPVESILAVYRGDHPTLPERSATEHNRLRVEGIRWYRDNRRMIRSVAAAHGLTRSTVAAVFAAYSINTSWKANVTVANRSIVAWLAGQTLRGMDTPVALATAALDSGNGDIILNMIGPDARKVRTFYGAFMGRSAVKPVIDRWANYIATGSKTVPSGKRYELVASYYIEAARRVGIRPEELQAATWTILRGTGS